MKKILCLHHNDNDGRAAAAVVAKAYIEDRGPDNPPTFIEMRYGDPVPWDQISDETHVVIVDYSIEPADMKRLLRSTNCSVVWIDHHKTAIDKYAGYGVAIPGIREVGTAACVLTWRHYFGDRSVPEVLWWIHDRDVWAWNFGETTAKVHAGLGVAPSGPLAEVWVALLAPGPNAEWYCRVKTDLLREGATILEYLKTRYADLGKLAYDTTLDGHKCRAMNVALVGSEVFGGTCGRMPEIEGVDIFITYYHDGSRWTVSLYSASVDVSEIAVAHGGGGHTGAAGFTCLTLPFGKEN